MTFRAMRSEAVAAPPRTGHRTQEGAVEVVFFHDVLCAWSYIADQRLQLLRAQYGPALSWSARGFPLRPDDHAPDKKQRAVFARHFRRAAKEREGSGVVADLWTGGDAPASSLPPLVALEAARQQSEEAHDRLQQALRQAAFLRGMNVCRRDVIVELAGSSGLDLPRFLEAFDDPRTEERVHEGVMEAESMEIKGVPALVIGGEWLLQGCRELSEYREVFDRYLKERATTAADLRVVH